MPHIFYALLEVAHACMGIGIENIADLFCGCDLAGAAHAKPDIILHKVGGQEHVRRFTDDRFGADGEDDQHPVM